MVLFCGALLAVIISTLVRLSIMTGPIVDKYFKLLAGPLPDCLTDCQIIMLGCLASHYNL